MKSLNLFRAATAAGLCGLCALATVVCAAQTPTTTAAAQPAAHITDLTKLQKFEHVIVVNATTPIASAKQSAATGSSMQMGQRAYIDGATRQLRAATQEELKQEAAADSAAHSALHRGAASNRSLRGAVTNDATSEASGPSAVYRESGGVGIQLDESFMAYEVAKIGPDGKLIQDCVGAQANDKAALNAKLGTTEEHGNER